MTIGPEPMRRIERMSVRRGILPSGRGGSAGRIAGRWSTTPAADLAMSRARSPPVRRRYPISSEPLSDLGEDPSNANECLLQKTKCGHVLALEPKVHPDDSVDALRRMRHWHLGPWIDGDTADKDTRSESDG